MKTINEDFSNLLEKFDFEKNNLNRLWNISEQTAQLIYFLAAIKSPKNILEIGTSNGYSTFWLSIASSGTMVHTIESDIKRFNLAKNNLKTIRNIKQYFGKAEDIIPKLNTKFDLVFIDACKVDYVNYLKIIMNKLNENALIITDNVISHSDSTIEFDRFIKNNPTFRSMTLAIDDGLEISIFNKFEDVVRLD